MQSTKPEREIPESYAVLIQRIITDWAATEFHVNECIWWLAKTPQGLGACITAQIFTLDGRLNALHALLKLRRADRKIIEDLNKIWEASHEPSRIRNRITHDPWALSPSGAVAQLEITAKRTLKFEFKPVDEQVLRRDHEKVRRFADRIVSMRNRIKAILQTLPEIPPAELDPITEVPYPGK